MDGVKLVYSVILIVCGMYIFISTVSNKGDERKAFIQMKAQSYSFIVAIGMLILYVLQSIFLTIQGNTSYDRNISPLMFLSVISIIYLATLFIYRRKYGD